VVRRHRAAAPATPNPDRRDNRPALTRMTATTPGMNPVNLSSTAVRPTRYPSLSITTNGSIQALVVRQGHGYGLSSGSRSPLRGPGHSTPGDAVCSPEERERWPWAVHQFGQRASSGVERRLGHAMPAEGGGARSRRASLEARVRAPAEPTADGYHGESVDGRHRQGEQDRTQLERTSRQEFPTCRTIGSRRWCR